jgi:hypothetical protein
VALAAGEKPRERQRYDDALHISRGLGFGYSPTPELMTRPIEELVRRVAVLIARRSVDVPEEVSAVLGGEDRPSLRVSELKTEYEALQYLQHRIETTRWAKSDHQQSVEAVFAAVDLSAAELT